MQPIATPFHVLRGAALSRRTFLRGAGAAIALPYLDAMRPALRGDRVVARPRTLFVFAPNGMKMDERTPAAVGPRPELPYLLAPLAPVRDRLTVLSGLTLDGARAHGDGPGDHARAAAAFLTCSHPVKTGGTDIRAGTSIDQVVAAAVGASTRFPSLELGLEGGRAAGICDSGYSCAYSNHIAWRTPTTPIAKETNPRALFARLFGDPDDVESAVERERRRRERRSVLDAVRGDARTLTRDLGPTDRQKLEMYLTALRELELRLQKEAADAAGERRIDVPESVRAGVGFRERLDAMYDVVALAFTADLTRTVTLMLGNGGSNLSYRFLDVPDGHHSVSHHGKKPENLAKIRTINRFHVERFAAFAAKLANVDDGGRDLLARTSIVYGSGIGDGDRHNHDELPIVLVGGGDGAFAGDRHLRFPRNTPLANLYVAVGRASGAKVETFGDASGRLEV
jgi:hypothetical protein